MIAGAGVRLLTIDDGVVQMDFNLVGAGRDLQDLRLIVMRNHLSHLCAIHEDKRTRRSPGDDDLRGWWQRGRSARTEPAAGGQASQGDDHEDFHARSVTREFPQLEPGTAALTMAAQADIIPS